MLAKTKSIILVFGWSMNKKIIKVHFVICALFLALILRIGDIISDDYYVQVMQTQSQRTLEVESYRGFIYDRNLKPLVNNTQSFNAAILPTVENGALILSNTDLLESELIDYTEKGQPFVAEYENSEQISENIVLFPDYERYSQNQIAPHVIGYLDYSGEVGITGVEKAYNELLSQDIVTNSVTYYVDGLGRAMQNLALDVNMVTPSSFGVVLTIDKDIQTIVEKVGGEYIQKGAIVVMETQTGNLLAVSSFPEYEPLDLTAYVSDEENSPMINRAFTPMSVGSSFKVLIAAAALMNEDFVDQPYVCTGHIQVEDQQFDCHKSSGHGEMTLESALENSCNPYFINLGLSIAPSDLWRIANDVGFGKFTEFGDGLVCAAGVLPSVEVLSSKGELANFSFGQGQLLATPVQIAQMMSVIANDGSTVTSNLVLGTTEDGINLDEFVREETSVNAVSKEAADIITRYLVSAVMDNPNHNAKTEDFNTAGKTSTAQTGIFIDGVEINHGWFAGFFPAYTPEYTIVVVVENAKSGNIDASPIYKKIAEYIDYLDSDLAKQLLNQ